MRQGRQPTSVRGNVQKSPSSKAAALLTRGAYSQVRERERREERQVCEPEGQAKVREHRWWLFSTFPLGVQDAIGHLWRWPPTVFFFS